MVWPSETTRARPTSPPPSKAVTTVAEPCSPPMSVSMSAVEADQPTAS